MLRIPVGETAVDSALGFDLIEARDRAKEATCFRFKSR